jgi:RHS repeat-associated protein
VADDLPLFTLDPSLIVPGFYTSALPQGYSNTIEILASGKIPGLLEPGESVTVPVYYAGMQQPWSTESQFHFDLRVFSTTDTDSVDWSSLQSSLQPAGISNAAWSAIYGNLTAQLGSTWGGYVQLLDNEAAYLGGLGEDVTDVNQLWGFAVQQADNALSPVGPTLASATDDSVAIPGDLSLSFSRVFAESIDGRDTMGPLGYGWSTPWQTTATTASDGTVTITGAGGARRVFQPDSRTAGAFFSEPGDTGTLTADGDGGYLLTEADGTATDYNANGTLNYLQDTNGNRITAGYTSGRLTSLTASSGQSITIGYNAAGLIATVSDSQGRATTYSYDPSNQYLMSVMGFNGQTTSYTYNTTSGAAAQNALTAITFPGGTHQYFTYDSEGRLSGTYNNGGAQPQSFAYAVGQVSITDGTGDISNLFYNEQGLVVKSIDPLGNVTLNTYDSNFNLTQVTNALGQSETYVYNAAGEVTSSTDFLGNTTYFVYSGPFNELASMTDANGNTTNYAYSSAGDLLSTTYANGTSESSSFNPLGEATSYLNANGQPTQYTYNSAGQIATETFSDGSLYAYTYDGQGNLLTATDATGTTTFTYDPVTQLMTKVAYPNGTSLSFAYNAAGQRTSMVDQTGFTVNYAYDSVGRLSSLTDGNGNLIVTYTNDNNGRLSLKTNGNGTYTTYQYDADGNVLHLINYAPNGTINSRFDYTYNALGLETTQITLDGTWTYTYDADGQLIQAVFASTNPSVPSQDLAYSYDAMGNRTTTVINGSTIAYITNNVNEYTSVGGVGYTYDKDGNLTFDGANTYSYNSLNQLISVTGPSGTTTYTYDSLGQRVSSTTNGVTTQYLIDPSGLGNVVGQYTSGGALIADYTFGLGLTSQVTAGGTYYYDSDALGSTVGLSNSFGSYVDKYSYLPFGGSLSATQTVTNPFQFVGQWGVMKDVNGLSWMRERFYDLSNSRFISTDPLGIHGNDSNPYRYGANDPLDKVDPSGLAYFVTRPFVFRPINFPYFPDPSDNLALVHEQIFFSDGTNLGYFDDNEVRPDDPSWLPSYDWSNAIYYPDDVVRQAIINVTAETGPYWLFPFWGYDNCQSWAEKVRNEADKLLKDQNSPIPPGGIGPVCAANAATSQDPNALIGPSGFGDANFVALSGAVFPYQIDFENSPTATAPAQDVTITDQLDANLDWNTFQLTGIAWGDTILLIPAGSQYYEATVPVTYNGQTFEVQVEAGIHTATEQVYATFQSIDPDTQLPPDVLTGFLPPEDGTGRGMGNISFMIQPNAGLATGTQIRNVALVTFDDNGSIATDQVDDDDPSQGVDPSKQALVTIDSGSPTSSVAALPAVSSTAAFTVNWSGTDDPGGSGIDSYSIFVSDDGGPFTPWLTSTTQTSASFMGLPGNSYGFYSVAIDNVGNVQPTAATAQATTLVQSTTTTFVSSDHAEGSVYGQSIAFSATVGASLATAGTPTGSVQFQIDGVDFGSPVTLSDGAASFTTASLSAGSYTIGGIYSSDSSSFGNSTGTFDASVLPATLTVTGNNQSMVYGGSLPALTVSYSGFVNGDNSTVIGGSASVSTTATPTSGVGTYSITATQGSLSATNYIFTFVAGALTITHAAPMVSVTDAGGVFTANPFPATATVTGISGVADSSLENVTPTLLYYVGSPASGIGSPTAPAAVGTYTVVATFAGSTDYTSGGNSATFTITAASNGAPNVTSQVNTTGSGLIRNRATGLFGGTVTLTNIGSTTLTGQLEFVFMGLPTGVTLANASGYTSGGNPYILVNLLNGTLAPGQSVTFTVQFSNPNLLSIQYFWTIFDENGSSQP